MRQLFFVFIGGGLGSVLRYIIGRYLNHSESGFPLGTFAVNILGKSAYWNYHWIGCKK